jgi:hypothetical protein
MIMQKYCEFFKPWHGLGSKTLQQGFYKQVTIMCFHPMTMDKVSIFTYGFCNYNVRLGKITIKRAIQVNEHSLNFHFCIFERSQRKHNNLDYHNFFGIFSINYKFYMLKMSYFIVLSLVPRLTRLSSMSFYFQEIVKDMKKHKNKG